MLGGPVTLAGRISGSLFVINGDVTFEPGAVVGGDVLVVGGTIEGQRNVAVAGSHTAAHAEVVEPLPGKGSSAPAP